MITDVAFAPDGKTLATGSHDGRVKLWNVATEQEVVTLPLEGMFTSLKFSPDGGTLVVSCTVPESSLEPRIRLWHAPSFEEIEAIEAQVCSCWFTKNCGGPPRRKWRAKPPAKHFSRRRSLFPPSLLVRASS